MKDANARNNDQNSAPDEAIQNDGKNTLHTILMFLRRHCGNFAQKSINLFFLWELLFKIGCYSRSLWIGISIQYIFFFRNGLPAAIECNVNLHWIRHKMPKMFHSFRRPTQCSCAHKGWKRKKKKIQCVVRRATAREWHARNNENKSENVLPWSSAAKSTLWWEEEKPRCVDDDWQWMWVTWSAYASF